MKTVKQACQLAPNALSIDVSDQIEQLDQLIQDEGNGEAFYSKTFITAGMRDLLRGTIERLAGKSCCRRPKTDSLKGLMPIQN